MVSISTETSAAGVARALNRYDFGTLLPTVALAGIGFRVVDGVLSDAAADAVGWNSGAKFEVVQVLVAALVVLAAGAQGGDVGGAVALGAIVALGLSALDAGSLLTVGKRFGSVAGSSMSSLRSASPSAAGGCTNCRSPQPARRTTPTPAYR